MTTYRSLITKNSTFLKTHLIKVLSVILLLASFSALSQSPKKYQSLLWEITGNGIERPSYLYGTMHVSSKLAFYLGDPFFDALASVDQVALELEPELWFDEVLSGNSMRSAFNQMRYDYIFGGYSDTWNDLEGSFKAELNMNLMIQNVFKQDPEMANQLLFRFYDPSGNFEEDTWLDMYIYQSAKKLGKTTLGLETYEESTRMMISANEESKDEDDPSRLLSSEERREIPMKIETAYRNGDLDLLDSLQALVSPPSYLKYILVERNRSFVKGLDTLIRQKPIFAAMGAAHLGGEEGCIEMLRALGFTVKPVAPGKRDAKRKVKIEKMVLERELKPFTSYDGVLSFSAPSKVYNFSTTTNTLDLVTMDIPNGSVTSINRLLNYSGLSQKSPTDLMLSLDSIMFETIPGEIVNQKSIENNGVKGFDILNKTRRGDYYRNQIYFLDDEIIVIRMTANGVKIKKGFGDEFFASISINPPKKSDWTKHEVLRNTVSFEAPGRFVSYNLKEDDLDAGNVFIQKADGKDFYALDRVFVKDQSYLDFDKYELDRLTDAFEKDKDLEETSRTWSTHQGGMSLKVNYKGEKGDKTHAMFVLRALGYYTFSAHTEDKTNAERYFKSIEINNPNYTNYFIETDSILHYSTKIPWDKNESKTDKLLAARAYPDYSDSKEIDVNRTFTRSKRITPPATSDWVEIIYFRFGKYQFKEDRAKLADQLNEIVEEDGDLVVDTSFSENTADGIIHNIDASDTATNRQYRIRYILKNRSLYTIMSTYDKLMGESNFAIEFRNNFQPIEDSLSFPNFFEEPDSMMIADIMSTDTNTYKNALDGIKRKRRYMKTETKLAMFKTITEKMPPLASKEEKEDLVSMYNDYWYADKSKGNINKLKEIYRANPDSAAYQQQVLENLTAMKTKAGMAAAKELLLEEAPIGVEFSYYSGMFRNLKDSMELAKTLYPQILELTAYDEYKRPLIALLAHLKDSGVVTKNVYRSYLQYFVREARAEYRRLSSNDGEQVTSSYNRKYNTNNYLMYYYWTLLEPFKNLEGPKKVFDLSKNAKKKHVIEGYAAFRHGKDLKISDKTCEKVMDREVPYQNYYILKKLGRLDYLSDTVNLHQQYVEHLIKKDWRTYNRSTKSEPDSIAFIKYELDSIRAQDYSAYYYKYLKESYGKKKWYFAVVMIKKSHEEFYQFSTIYLKTEEDPSKTEEEQFDFMRKKLINAKRHNLSNFSSFKFSNPFISNY